MGQCYKVFCRLFKDFHTNYILITNIVNCGRNYKNYGRNYKNYLIDGNVRKLELSDEHGRRLDEGQPAKK
jgi:hypothetical protein